MLSTQPEVEPEIVIIGPMYPPTQARLEAEFTAHRLWEAPDQAAFLQGVADRVRGVAVYALHGCAAAVIEACHESRSSPAWASGSTGSISLAPRRAAFM